MISKVVVAVPAVAALVFLAWSMRSDVGTRDREVGPEVGAREPAPAPGEPVEGRAEAGPSRTADPEPRPQETAAPGPPVSPPEPAVKIVHDGGEPLAGATYWLQWKTPLLAHGDRLPDLTPPAKVLTTDARGRLDPGFPPGCDQVVVWCRVHAGYMVGFELGRGDHRRIRLLPVADLTVTCTGLEPQEVWITSAHPGRRADAVIGIASRRIHTVEGSAGQRVVHVATEQTQRARGSAAVRLPGIAGDHLVVSATAHHHIVDPVWQRADLPARLVFPSRGLSRTLSVSVYEPGGVTLTTMPGKVVVGAAHSRQMYDLEQGACTVAWGYLKPQADYRVWVTMSDDESFRGAFRVESESPPPLSFVRGTGRIPWDVCTGSDDVVVSDDCPVVLEAADGRLLTGVTEARRSLFKDEPFTYRLVDGRTIRFLDLEPGWRCGWILRPSGDAAKVVPLGDAHRLQARWLPRRELADVYPRAAIQRLSARGGGVIFELQLTGDLGQTLWVPVDSIRYHSAAAMPETWSKHAPTGMPHRFRLLTEAGDAGCLTPGVR